MRIHLRFPSADNLLISTTLANVAGVLDLPPFSMPACGEQAPAWPPPYVQAAGVSAVDDGVATLQSLHSSKVCHPSISNTQVQQPSDIIASFENKPVDQSKHS